LAITSATLIIRGDGSGGFGGGLSSVVPSFLPAAMVRMRVRGLCGYVRYEGDVEVATFSYGLRGCGDGPLVSMRGGTVAVAAAIRVGEVSKVKICESSSSEAVSERLLELPPRGATGDVAGASRGLAGACKRD
jgi:hypothetical protein